jgi:hypothetical protein
MPFQINFFLNLCCDKYLFWFNGNGDMLSTSFKAHSLDKQSLKSKNVPMFRKKRVIGKKLIII